MRVSLELCVRRDLSHDDSANTPSFGIPSHVVADRELFRHHVTYFPQN